MTFVSLENSKLCFDLPVRPCCKVTTISVSILYDLAKYFLLNDKGGNSLTRLVIFWFVTNDDTFITGTDLSAFFLNGTVGIKRAVDIPERSKTDVYFIDSKTINKWIMDA